MSESINNARQRNCCLDFAKGIAAIGVVLVHFPFPGVFGRTLASVGVCGVILFFMISGYYAYDPDDAKACGKLLKRFRRNLILTLIAVAAYLAFTVIEQLILGTFSEWAEQFKDPWLLPRMVILGDFEFIHGDPLWFMPALLYSYLIFYLLHKHGITKQAYKALPFLLLLRVGMETYTNSFDADWHLSGNFLVGAMPIMLLGHFIAYKKESFTKLPLRVTFLLAGLSMITMFVFVNLKFGRFDVSQSFKIWCAFEVFIITLCLPEKKVIPAVGVIGSRYSLNIYLSHYAIGVLVLDILLLDSAPEWSTDWLLPVSVIIASLLFSMCIYKFLGNKKSA